MQLDNLHRLEQQALYYFYWAAHLKNFTKAAHHCRCSKSHISKAITKLESDLQQKLFQRTTRQIELTTVGRHLYLLLENSFARLEQGISQLQEITKQPHGDIHITAPPALAENLLAPVLGAFIESYDSINIHCHCESKQIDIIKEGFDFAFRNAKLEDSNYIARHLTDIQFVCVATKKLAKQLKGITQPSLINDYPVFMYSGSSNNSIVFQHKKKQQFVNVTPKFTSNLSMMILSTLMQSQGIAILPDFLVEKELSDKKLIHILPEWHLNKVPLYLVYPSKEYMPLSCKLFIKHVQHYFKS